MYVNSNNQRIQSWGRRRPRLLEYFNKLNTNDIPWAIYCSASVSLLTGSRQHTDVDIVVPDDYLDYVVPLSPKKRAICCNQACTVLCGDGAVLDFPEASVKFNIDDEEVEVMASGSAKLNNQVYKFQMSPTSIENRLEVILDDVTIYFANPFDTMALKSVLQRGPAQNKFDKDDVKSLKKFYTPSEKYMSKRASEIGLDERSLRFLQNCDVELAVAV